MPWSQTTAKINAQQLFHVEGDYEVNSNEIKSKWQRGPSFSNNKKTGYLMA
jgi:hypothetical protein